MLLVDFQAGLGFGVDSVPRQVVLNNAVALVRTVVAFKVPVIGSTSAARVCQVGRKAPAFLGRGYGRLLNADQVDEAKDFAIRDVVETA
jgi:hypothetical protein